MDNPRLAQQQSERRLCVLYFGLAALSTVALITTLVAFGYWHWTLNLCQEQDYVFFMESKYKQRPDYERGKRAEGCGCLLYAQSSFHVFRGGTTATCDFVKYSNIPGLVIGLCLGAWHWYRSTFTLRKKPKQKRKRRIVANDNPEVYGVVAVVTPPPSTFSTVSWLCCAFWLLLEAILTLAAAGLITDGTLRTCREYRQNLIETINADGNMAPLIKERLLCNAVFDFMDYLLPVKYRLSGNFINTGAALYFAIFAMWTAAIGWVVATMTNVYEAFRYRRVCCGRN